MHKEDTRNSFQNGHIYLLQVASSNREPGIRKALEQEGYEVMGGRLPVDFGSLFGSFQPDVVLIAGPDVRACVELRRRYPNLGLLCLEASVCEERTALLEAGADDCLPSGSDPRELIARVRAVVRRYNPVQDDDGDRIRYENFSLSRKNYELRLCGEQVSLPPKELELLYCLAAHPNHVFTREELLDQVWGFEYLGDTRTIDVHIKRLRNKCEGLSKQWGIRTIWGVGYKFETAV